MRAHVIANPAAGRGTGAALAASVARFLQRRGWSAELTVTGESGHAQKIAGELRPSEVDLVVAVGGDGLVNEIINGPLDASIALGLIPAGTGNVLAREFGMPFDWRSAAELLLRSVPVRLDVGNANGRRFLLMVGVGWDAHLLEEVQRKPRPWLGIWQYVPAIAKMAWRPQRYDFSVAADGEHYQSAAWMLVACNTNLYTWLFRLTPEASPVDGVLDFVLLRGGGRMALSKAALWSVFRKRVGEEEALYFRAVSARVCTTPAAPFQVDGDRAGTAPLSIALQPRALRLMVPGGHPLARHCQHADEERTR